ncbi:PPE protein (fragment) [uncultured Mycobacterium sp.]|uniref:PPE protein n=1 Tax=uncultured Mycobacterium sp. TaxID=171292 RepID=A0A1Y5PG96_9MYCO
MRQGVLVGLRVDPDQAQGAGMRMAQSVTAPITLVGVVTPAAADDVATTVAPMMSVRLQMISEHPWTRSTHITATAASVLRANTATYQEQETLNAAALRPGGAVVGP